jgi:hypothetical protein
MSTMLNKGGRYEQRRIGSTHQTSNKKGGQAMTEKEAKQRWCPMVRIIMTPQDSTWQNQGLTNRTAFLKDGFPNCCCIGSNCMMWRWIILPLDCKEQKCKEAIGYCGLAGKP